MNDRTALCSKISYIDQVLQDKQQNTKYKLLNDLRLTVHTDEQMCREKQKLHKTVQ